MCYGSSGTKKLAVIKNEVGEASIDDHLVGKRPEDMAEQLDVLDNGCIRCIIWGDLFKTLCDLSTKQPTGLRLDGIFVELTGVADPAPVVQAFRILFGYLDQTVRGSFYVSNVVCLVDARHAKETLDESKSSGSEKGIVSAQIALSSTVILNKIDLVDSKELGEIEGRIRLVNSTVDIVRCEHGRAPLDQLMHGPPSWFASLF